MDVTSIPGLHTCMYVCHTSILACINVSMSTASILAYIHVCMYVCHISKPGLHTCMYVCHTSILACINLSMSTESILAYIHVCMYVTHQYWHTLMYVCIHILAYVYILSYMSTDIQNLSI